MPVYSQFHHLGTASRAPRKGDRAWACVAGITAEGARVPGSSNHVPFPKAPELLFGISPIAAGKLATKRGDQARDAKGRRLRCDGVVLLCGVVSYPVPKAILINDPVEHKTYLRWRQKVIEWLKRFFGDHLKSIVEHGDEDRLHLHYFVVPELREDNRLDLNEIHPGRRMKQAAAEAGASKKDQDAAYRRGMERWQDEFHHDVSRGFDHERYMPKRARITRQERQAQRRTEDEAERQRAELDLAQVAFETEAAGRRAQLAVDETALKQQLAEAQAEIDRQRAMLERRNREVQAELERKQAHMVAIARQNAWDAFGRPLKDTRAAYARLKERCGIAEGEVERLRERLSELEPVSSCSFTA